VVCVWSSELRQCLGITVKGPKTFPGKQLALNKMLSQRPDVQEKCKCTCTNSLLYLFGGLWSWSCHGLTKCTLNILSKQNNLVERNGYSIVTYMRSLLGRRSDYLSPAMNLYPVSGKGSPGRSSYTSARTNDPSHPRGIQEIRWFSIS
jgi:hypothetical protein